jgi:hypothetical protein
MKSSRRRFLKSTLAGPLAAALTRPGIELLALPPADPAQEQFENPHIIRYDSSCFTINGRDTFIYSAAFHYSRCPKALWRDRLVKFKQAGFNAIETYVFWNYHEPEEGKANLGDFEEFVKLVQDLRFFLIARPGPYVCAEWERGGFPSWVAAKRFPLRTNHPESIKTSQHWFNLVLPIIQRHQITVGGPIIMVQVENEYDYSPPIPPAEKKEYVRALAQMAWNAGIRVPIITCWTKQARENADADMARIMDTCNFYPRWDIVRQVVPELQKLRKEEPASPVGVTELQGGWFSQIGAKLSIEQDGITGQQLNMLTKTVIEQGATYYSYYMGFGGTNFDWGAKTMTTSYDYACPIREPGGLWEKYYAARGICLFLGMYGSVLARAQAQPGTAQSTNKEVSVTQRTSGKTAVVFVRENANAEQHFKMTFVDPASPTQRKITVPREGELVLGAREMKMIPVQVPIWGSMLRYSTAEVLAHGLLIDRHFVILYDEPGRLAEIALYTEEEPKVEGETAYQYWDQEYESVVFGVRVEKTEKLLLVNHHLLVVVLPRDRALRSWTQEFSPKVVPGAEETKPMSVPFLTDAYRLTGSGRHKNGLWADMDLLPGEHDLTVLLPPAPTKCRVDGVLSEFKYDRAWRTTRLRLTTPPLPAKSLALSDGRSWVEKFDPASGQWLNSPARALEDLGLVPYGYVKYRAQFNYSSQPKMFITTFTDDGKKVFLNGKLVPEASNPKRHVEFDLAKYAQAGANTLEIAYEAFGASNGGKELGDLKGIESVRIGSEAKSGTPIDSWQIQRYPALMRGREVDPEFGSREGSAVSLGATGSAKDLVPAFTWFRTEFALETPAEGWTVPWKLAFEAARDALLYLNGKFVGRYVTIGPQKEFYLPEPYLNFGGKKNMLTLVLAYTDQPGHIRTLRVAPYTEFSVRRTRVEFEW